MDHKLTSVFEPEKDNNCNVLSSVLFVCLSVFVYYYYVYHYRY